MGRGDAHLVLRKVKFKLILHCIVRLMLEHAAKPIPFRMRNPIKNISKAESNWSGLSRV